jgi:uncharacterized protein (TIGR03067 family)
MKHADTDHRRASRISRLVDTAGLVLLVSGTGLALQTRSLAHDDATVAVASAPAKIVRGTQREVVREKKTGRLAANAQVNASPVGDEAGCASSTAVPDDKSDQEKMEGKWKIVQHEFAGEKGTQSVGVEDTFSGGKWIRPKRRTGEYQLKLDSTKDPKWVDLSAERLGDKTLKGIYLLEGDKLTICYAYDPELPRPTEFKTMPGVQSYMYVLERVKKE